MANIFCCIKQRISKIFRTMLFHMSITVVKSKEILAENNEDTDKDLKKTLKIQAKAEKSQYSVLKKSRWTLLMNSNNLSDNRAENLKDIFSKHQNLAVCYAMKEEMCRLFKIYNYTEALSGWQAWFSSAKESNIPTLVNFAEQKEKRINGLVAHAVHNISTGKLEGFNNKIKVAKRIACGYRNEKYFFTLIRYLSIPAVINSFHNFS